MRHLSVPSQDTQRVLLQLKAESALPEGARVRSDPDDSGRRLIPFIDTSSQTIAAQYPVIDIDVDPPPARTYRDHLEDFLPAEIIASTEWPTRHEFVGDLILIKLDENQRQHGPTIGQPDPGNNLELPPFHPEWLPSLRGHPWPTAMFHASAQDCRPEWSRISDQAYCRKLARLRFQLG